MHMNNKLKRNSVTRSCPYCGKPIPMDTKFCPYCGQPLPLNQTMHTHTHHHGKITVILLAILLILFIILGIHLNNQYLNPNTEMAKTAVSQPWNSTTRTPYNSDGSTIYFHKDGTYTGKLYGNSQDTNGRYKFSGNTLTMKTESNLTTLTCVKYSHGEYLYYVAKSDGQKLDKSLQKKNKVTFVRK